MTEKIWHILIHFFILILYANEYYIHMYVCASPQVAMSYYDGDRMTSCFAILHIHAYTQTQKCEIYPKANLKVVTH